MSLAPIALGMTGLQFSLFVNGLIFAGVDDEPAEEGAPDPMRTAAVASLVAAISLVFMAFWFVIDAPLGTEGGVGTLQLTFSAIAGMYGFLHIGFFFTQYWGLDLRQVGNAALGVGIMQLLFIPVVAGFSNLLGFGNMVAINVVLAWYVVIMAAVWGATHERSSAKLAGYTLLVGFVLTFYLQFVASGIVPAPF